MANPKSFHISPHKYNHRLGRRSYVYIVLYLPTACGVYGLNYFTRKNIPQGRRDFFLFLANKVFPVNRLIKYFQLHIQALTRLLQLQQWQKKTYMIRYWHDDTSPMVASPHAFILFSKSSQHHKIILRIDLL